MWYRKLDRHLAAGRIDWRENWYSVTVYEYDSEPLQLHGYDAMDCLKHVEDGTQGTALAGSSISMGMTACCARNGRTWAWDTISGTRREARCLSWTGKGTSGNHTVMTRLAACWRSGGI